LPGAGAAFTIFRRWRCLIWLAPLGLCVHPPVFAPEK
jgi:hypothetical protein